MIINPYAFGGGGGESLLTCDAADFDGTNDVLTKASFTGQADSKSGILSVWFQLDRSGSGNSQDFMSCVKVDHSIVIEFTAAGGVPANTPTLFFSDATGTILNINSTVTVATATWYHLLASWDVNSSLSHFYLNDVDRKSTTAINNRVVPYGTTQEWSVGDYSPFDGAGLRMDGGMAELFFAPGQFLDFSVQSNRRKFRSSGGKPINLGADGSTPTGTKPLIYLHLDDAETANNFATNRAGNGNLTVTGALTTRATSPSD